MGLNGRIVSTRAPRPFPGTDCFFPCLPTSISRRPSLSFSLDGHSRTRRSPCNNGLPSYRLRCSFQLFSPAVVRLTLRRRSAAEKTRPAGGKIKTRRKPAASKGCERRRKREGRGRRSPEVVARHLREPLFVSPPGEISAKFTVETRPINFTLNTARNV